MALGNQIKNGKAFEYALLNRYAAYLRSIGVNVSVEEDSAYYVAKNCYYCQDEISRKRFDDSADATIDTIVKLEPGLTSEKYAHEPLFIHLAPDSDGQQGDVRDVIFERPASKWQVGFSAKNNHDAVKHSRLSNTIDFGLSWLGKPCSEKYWDDIAPIFDKILEYKRNGYNWDSIPYKFSEIYCPLLEAFRAEVLRLSENDKDVPADLIRYLIGRHPFYKIIKDDRNNLVVVKAFNIENGLNKKVNGLTSRYKTASLNLPKRIVEFDLKNGAQTTLIMILDEGWEISFRIHNADKKIESSLKFDIQLLGNPPILFTQHLFQ